MTTTAEGVKTKEQYDLLRSEGCTRIQGFYISRPAPHERLAELIEQHGFRKRGRLNAALRSRPPQRPVGGLVDRAQAEGDEEYPDEAGDHDAIGEKESAAPLAARRRRSSVAFLAVTKPTKAAKSSIGASAAPSFSP